MEFRIRETAYLFDNIYSVCEIGKLGFPQGRTPGCVIYMKKIKGHPGAIDSVYLRLYPPRQLATLSS